MFDSPRFSDKLKNITTPNSTDVLFGRGKSIQCWEGNVRYRDLIHNQKYEYVIGSNGEKKRITLDIISQVRSSNGRFLAFDEMNNNWFDVGNAKAYRKTRQALRENAPDILQMLSPGSLSPTLVVNETELEEEIRMIFSPEFASDDMLQFGSLSGKASTKSETTCRRFSM